MALQHEFVFVSNEKGESSSEDFFWNDKAFSYKDGTAVEECVILSDEFVMYVIDFLQWLPTYNPSRRKYEFGINYYGITKIEKEGAKIAANLFQSLISLFSLAPEKIELTGSFQWQDGENIEDGEYEQLSFDRNVLCTELEQLVRLLQKVKQEEGYLLHFGV